MLLGEYEHTIDDKNRLTLPVKFRESFAEGIVVTRGLDGCLERPESAWLSEADGETRTPDPIITSDVLYQLSYVGNRRGRRAATPRRILTRAAPRFSSAR